MADNYWAIALVAADTDLQSRVTAAAAQQNADDPAVWAATHTWQYAAQPGWGEAYQYALDNGNETPGKDPAVITDAQILSAVQLLLVE